MSDAFPLEWRRPRSWPSTRPWPAVAFPRLVRAAVGRAIGLATRPALLALALPGLACVLFASAYLALPSLHFAASLPSPLPPAAPEWIDVQRPIHIFDLESPVLRGLPLVYSARRRSAGDEREDMMAYGTPGVTVPGVTVPGDDATSLRLRVTRRGGAIASQPPLFADVARLAAESGLSVARAGLVDLLPTRFGAFEIADVGLTDAKAVAVPCSGFRLAQASPVLIIDGFACGTTGKPPTRLTVGCLLDRLDLRSGGDDRALIDVFAASERRRDPNCKGARLAPDALHAAWLDDKPVTHGRTSRRR